MKAIIAILLLFICVDCFSQKNTIYVTFQPTDIGFGFRYDRQVGNCGLYTSVSHGRYGFYEDNYINNHIKLALGGYRYLKDYLGAKMSVGGGLTYNRYEGRHITMPGFPGRALRPVSFEVVFNSTGPKGFAMSLRYDFLKNESAIDIGMAF